MDKKPKTLIFDCFGVVCDPFLSKWLENSGIIDENIKNIFRQSDLGIMSYKDVYEYFSKYKGIKATKEEIEEAVYRYLNLNKDLIGVIKKLKDKGFKIALLTNSNRSIFDEKIFKLFPDFKNLFDEIVISSEVGMVKPDPGIFLHTLDKLGSKPDETVFIDDSKGNVDAAIKLGMDGFVYKDVPSFLKYIKTLGIDLN